MKLFKTEILAINIQIRHKYFEILSHPMKLELEWKMKLILYVYIIAHNFIFVDKVV